MAVNDDFRFVALGDSLTVGYQSPTPERLFVENSPFTVRLASLTESLLNSRGLSRISVRFVNAGANGDTTAGMLRRFTRDVASQKPRYIIVWAGINDLYYGEKPDSVVNNLQRLYGETEKIDARPIACTVAPVEDNLAINELVRQLNQKINNLSETTNTLCADLYSALADDYGKLAHRYSNDTLHLTNEGYAVVAQTIFRETINRIFSDM